MKLKTIIIDDEPLAHEVILKYMEDIPFLEPVAQFYLATDALVFLHQHCVDLIFLDIHMPKLSGLAFLKTLKDPPTIIITTAYAEFALQGFEWDVCDYLLKPFRFERFLKAANKALAQQDQKKLSSFPEAMPEQKIPPMNEFQHIFIKTDNRFLHLETKEIYYLESYGNYVKVWSSDQFHLTSRTLLSFEEQLSSRLFIRIHKSFIINRIWVDYLEGNRLFLKNGIELPIGKNHKQAFKQFMSEQP